MYFCRRRVTFRSRRRTSRSPPRDSNERSNHEQRSARLPPEIAADMALGIELTTPVLLVLGLLTRAAALVPLA
jgi:uncharacterized membrane protein YphA (DoxX/SURF4 family)